MKKDKLVVLANSLEQAMDELAEAEAAITPIKERVESIREELLTNLTKRGLKFAKTDSGLGFGVQERKTLSIKEGMEADALAWAQKEYPHILTVAKPAMNKILKPMLQLPAFIEESITRYLSVRTTEAD